MSLERVLSPAMFSERRRKEQEMKKSMILLAVLILVAPVVLAQSIDNLTEKVFRQIIPIGVTVVSVPKVDYAIDQDPTCRPVCGAIMWPPCQLDPAQLAQDAAAAWAALHLLVSTGEVANLSGKVVDWNTPPKVSVCSQTFYTLGWMNAECALSKMSTDALSLNVGPPRAVVAAIGDVLGARAQAVGRVVDIGLVQLGQGHLAYGPPIDDRVIEMLGLMKKP